MTNREAYIQGKIDEATALAVWRDGQQYVGVRGTPLEEYIEYLRDEPVPREIIEGEAAPRQPLRATRSTFDKADRTIINLGQ